MASNPLAQLPVLGSLFDDTGDQARAELEKNKALYDAINLPQFKDYNPEMESWLQNYDPEQAQYQTISEDPRLKTAQMSALQKLSGLADTGLSEQDEASFLDAKNQAGQLMRQGSQAALQNAQSRGVGGSGLEFAMREMANQDAAGRTQSADLQEAADAAKQRALYATAYGNELGQVRGQDLQANSANADIINRFNMANTNAANQAAQYNIQGRQQTANTNAATQNQAQQYANSQAQQQFANQMSKANGAAGVNQQMAQSYNQEGAANQANRNALTQVGLGVAMAGMGGAAKAAPAATQMAGGPDLNDLYKKNMEA